MLEFTFTFTDVNLKYDRNVCVSDLIVICNKITVKIFQVHSVISKLSHSHCFVSV